MMLKRQTLFGFFDRRMLTVHRFPFSESKALIKINLLY